MRCSRNSGGSGRFPGGDGIVRELDVPRAGRGDVADRAAHATHRGVSRAVMPEHRVRIALNGVEVAAKVALDVREGDVLTIATPGGGGWGRAQGLLAARTACLNRCRPSSSVARGHPKLKRTKPGP